MPNLSKELRKQRRREEHKARKAANRAGIFAEPLTAPASSSPSLPGFFAPADRKNAEERQSETPRENGLDTVRAERNRRNAQLSTGPRTSEGKARASQNAIRHGLSSDKFLILDWENLDDFALLLVNLRAEHPPATQTEALLVEKMAQHFWLSQRALRLQDMCLNRDLPVCEEPKQMALYMRYGVTHDRAFHKCLAELLKLRAVQHKEEAGFVSQQRQAAAERRKEQLHHVRMAAANAKAAAVIAKSTRPASQKTAPTPLLNGKSTALNPVNLPEYPESSAAIRPQAA